MLTSGGPKNGGDRHMNSKYFIISIIALAACLAPTVSSACQPPPDEWVFDGSWPQDGAVDVASDSSIRLFFNDDYGTAPSALQDILTVTVTDQETGEEIPGEFGQEDHLGGTLQQGASGRIIWHPMEPFVPGRSYGVAGVIDDPSAYYGEGISGPFSFTFTTSDEMEDVRPPVVSLTGLSASHGDRDLTRCIGSMYCDGTCDREEVVDTVPELRLVASVHVSEDRLAGEYIIRVGTGSSAESAQRRAGRDRAFFSRRGHVGLYRSELLSIWNSEEFCVHAEIIDEEDTVIEEVTQCVPIQPRENDPEDSEDIKDGQLNDRPNGDSEDRENELAFHGGCDASSHGTPSSRIAWAVFALLGCLRLRNRLP